MEKATDRALVSFKCEGCGKVGEKAGPCMEEACKEKRAMIVEVCSKSGTFPHVAEK